MFKSLVSKITLLFSCTMTLLNVVIIVAIGWSIRSTRSQVVQTQQALLEYYCGQFDSSLDQLRVQMAQFSTHDLAVITLGIYEPTGDAYMLNLQDCLQSLQKTVNTNPLLETSFLYAQETNATLTASRSYTSYRNLYITRNIASLQEYCSNVSSSSWDLIRADGYFGDKRDNIWTLIKIVKASDGVWLGSLVSAASLLPPLSSLTNTDGAIFAIADKRGNILESTDELSQFPPGIISESVKDNQVAWIQSRSPNNKYVAVSFDSERAPIRIISLLPESSVIRPLQSTMTLAKYLPFALILFIIVLSIATYRSLNRPFQTLTSGMGLVATGDLSYRLPDASTTEFRYLHQQFNQMVGRIESLNRDVLQQTEKTYRAEIRHLQAQINPHFFQNSLNIIYSLAALGRTELIQQITLYLADYFRFIMRSGDTPVTMAEELKHVSNYMEIQKVRYAGSIDYSITCPDELTRICILPLTIQPLVENSVVHGFTAVRPFRVAVNVYQEGPQVLIDISDNGNGIDEAILRRLNSKAENDTYDRHDQIGIWNVVMRLRRYIGDRSRVVFYSVVDEGTLARIEIPFTVDEDQNESLYS